MHPGYHVQLRSSKEWKSNELVATFCKGTIRLVHRHRSHRSAFSGSRSGTCSRCWRNLRAGCSNRVAHASAWADPDRHQRVWMGAALGRTCRGNSSRRCGLDFARRKALARRYSNYSHGAHRHSEEEGRQGCGLDGTRDGSTIPRSEGVKNASCDREDVTRRIRSAETGTRRTHR